MWLRCAMSWGSALRCPVCGEPMAHRRPQRLVEEQPGLQPGWDCVHDHALHTPAPDYRRAQMERLTTEIQEMLEPRVDLTEPVDLRAETDVRADAPADTAADPSADGR